MGRTGKVIGIESSANGVDIKIDLGGGEIITAEHLSPTGEDSRPVLGDYAVTSSQPGSGRQSVVAYDDAANSPESLNGEVKRAGRDASGAIVCWLWLRADGSVVVENASGSKLSMNTDGTITANTATITADGDVQTPEGVSLKNHTHPTGVGPSGPPTPTPAP